MNQEEINLIEGKKEIISLFYAFCISFYFLDFNRYLVTQEEARLSDCRELGTHLNKLILEMITTNKKLRENLVQLKNSNKILNQNAENLEMSLNQERKKRDQMRNYSFFILILI